MPNSILTHRLNGKVTAKSMAITQECVFVFHFISFCEGRKNIELAFICTAYSVLTLTVRCVHTAYELCLDPFFFASSMLNAHAAYMMAFTALEDGVAAPVSNLSNALSLIAHFRCNKLTSGRAKAKLSHSPDQIPTTSAALLGMGKANN